MLIALVRGHLERIAMLGVLNGDGSSGTAPFVAVANVGKVFCQSVPRSSQIGIAVVGNDMRPLHRLLNPQKDQSLVQSANEPLILIKPGWAHSVDDA